MADTITIKQFKKRLEDLKNNTTKQITVKTLNEIAYQTQQKARQTTEKEFTLRNKYATKSIIYIKASQKKQYSITGSTAPFQEYHEKGKVLKRNLWGKSSNINPLATIHARGGQYTKTIRSRYRFNRMEKIRDMRKGDSRRAGEKLFILPTKNKEAIIYERFGKKRKDIRPIRILSRGKKVNKRPIFKNSANFILKSNIAYNEFAFQVKKNLIKP